MSGRSAIRQEDSSATDTHVIEEVDRQRQLLAQLNRWEQRIAQMKTEVTESINHINVALNDIEEFRRREGAGTETPSTNGLVGADHDDTAEQDRGSDT